MSITALKPGDVSPGASPNMIALGIGAVARNPWQVQITDEHGVILDVCDERLAKALHTAFWAAGSLPRGDDL